MYRLRAQLKPCAIQFKHLTPAVKVYQALNRFLRQMVLPPTNPVH